ncbi:jg3600 [Pararge aegeria aegeria]|uniref:Jg3600 protein n=1 Tax=Pararge aegeria aegeria TaxID=348720 RepID=A0A8S4R5U5_9NEOP|nr:jg3600 [Pararge aegeria aegeria]
MLREAHRDREEKISALQTQLECKNMAGLMYVMCAERRKSRMEILRLTEGSRLLQKGCLDTWNRTGTLNAYAYASSAEYTNYIRTLQQILEESQALILHLSRGYKTTARVNHEWQEKMKKIIKHFQNFVNNFTGGPPETNQYVFDLPNLLKIKTPIEDNTQEDSCDDEDTPNENVFHDMFVKAECPHTNTIKDEYMKRGSSQPLDKWASAQTDKQTSSRGGRMFPPSVTTPQSPALLGALLAYPRLSIVYTAVRLHSLPLRPLVQQWTVKDSTCQEMSEDFEAEQDEVEEPEIRPGKTISRDEEDMTGDTTSALGSIHNDSLQVINQHVPEIDHKIHYEKICPMEKCQKMQMDDFMSSLPSYMRASPFTHFEQSFEDYEPCTPEQLEILKKRMEEKKKKERVAIDVIDDNPLLSWPPSVEGIAVQTSSQDMSIPPCTCDVAGSDAAEISQSVYNIVDLIPVKQELDRINAKCFFDDTIEFNRFKIIGQDENEDTEHENKNSFSKNRLEEIKKILKQYPSLCNIFQANIRC